VVETGPASVSLLQWATRRGVALRFPPPLTGRPSGSGFLLLFDSVRPEWNSLDVGCQAPPSGCGFVQCAHEQASGLPSVCAKPG
jgi:hypothetical protein